MVKRMREGVIEETRIPRNPLDVLASRSSPSAPTRRSRSPSCIELVQGAYPFADLSRAQLENILDMLAGRYPSDEFAELRPRIVWDRTAGVIRGRPGAQRLAVTNAGTIPDRGLFGVFLSDGGGRVGELDEEMVYEARAGQVIVLGASSWRIEEITRDRVLVSPAPGVPGAVPFWKGEGIGRPVRAGRGDRASSRESWSPSTTNGAFERLAANLDPRAARNLLAYLSEQERSDRGRPVRPDGRRRALPRRDRRLARGHADAVRGARPRALGDGRGRPAARRRSGSRCTRSGRTTGSRSTCPMRTRRRRPTCWCSARKRSRSSSSASWGRGRSSEPASARTLPVRSSSREGGPGSARRSGSSG